VLRYEAPHVAARVRASPIANVCGVDGRCYAPNLRHRALRARPTVGVDAADVVLGAMLERGITRGSLVAAQDVISPVSERMDGRQTSFVLKSIDDHLPALALRFAGVLLGVDKSATAAARWALRLSRAVR
jgi:hypothetical protein